MTPPHSCFGGAWRERFCYDDGRAGCWQSGAFVEALYAYTHRHPILINRKHILTQLHIHTIPTLHICSHTLYTQLCSAYLLYTYAMPCTLPTCPHILALSSLATSTQETPLVLWAMIPNHVLWPLKQKQPHMPFPLSPSNSTTLLISLSLHELFS